MGLDARRLLASPGRTGKRYRQARGSPGGAGAFEDAAAYAAKAGKDQPTDAEWEFAACGGLDGAEFAWGDQLTPNGTHLANTWQVPFPWRNFETDGFTGICPVRSIPANGYGLYEVCGNVWEWTTDWFVAKHDPADPAKPSCCAVTDPRGPAREAIPSTLP
ncbi:MAG: SUMF1/EgtB/PvdO family nonheme iron enzyme [Rhodobacteraceae bacterium]|nr:SUMF1/EgtB/PvdO family nonheme iron enzyme [Paracoccaceae bacterium]